jgi:hypothetical protein
VLAIAGLAVVAALAGVYVLGKRSGGGDGVGGAAGAAASAAVMGEPTPPAPALQATSDAAAVAATAADAGVVAAAAEQEPAAGRMPGKWRRHTGARPRDDGEEAADDAPPPPEAAAHLAEAERSLIRGDADEAIRRARQSFFVKRSNRGWALLTRAFCRKGDLGNARASLQNVRRGPERVRVIRECQKFDVDLR